MGTLLQDLRYGFRMMLKHPGFTVVAVLALGLGIGANTAIFSVVNVVLLRPLPFEKPEQLVMVKARDLRPTDSTLGSVDYPDFRDWRAQNHVFERLSGYRNRDFTLTGGSEPVQVHSAVVSADLFQLLGASPILGRTFLPEEDRPGGSNGGDAVVLTHSLWQRRFGSDPNVVGQALVLNGKSFNVVGVMPEGFKFPIQADPIDLWTTFAVDSVTADGTKPITEERGAHFFNVIGRLKPNVTIEQAQAEMSSIMSNLEKQYPDTNAHEGVQIVPALESLVGDTRPALLILLGAVGCVLLIACANVANLLLARATSRHKEIAIRAALGASRLRVIRLLLTESVLLSLVGGALGLLLALWGTDVLVALSPRNIPRITEIGLDTSVLSFTLLVSLLTGMIFGLAPALHATKSDLTESLKEGGRGSTEFFEHLLLFIIWNLKYRFPGHRRFTSVHQLGRTYRCIRKNLSVPISYASI